MFDRRRIPQAVRGVRFILCGSRHDKAYAAEVVLRVIERRRNRGHRITLFGSGESIRGERAPSRQLGRQRKPSTKVLHMTMIDDATAKAKDFLKNAENVVQSFRVLTASHKADLANNFPTLVQALGSLAKSYDSLGVSPTESTPTPTTPPTP